MRDCYYFRTNSTKVSNGVEGGDYKRNDMDSDLTDDEYHTCGHRDNTYKAPTEPSKRIDFILFRLFDKIESSAKRVCKVEHLSIVCKDESGMSFSDHQPVVALFKLKCFDVNKIKRDDSSDEENTEECIEQNTNRDTESKDQSVCVSSGNQRRNCAKHYSVGDGSNGCDQLHESFGDGGDGCRRVSSVYHRADKNINTHVLPEAKNGHLNHTHNNGNNRLLRKRNAKLKPTRKQLLAETKALLEEYVRENRWTLKYFMINLMFSMAVMSLLMYALLIWAQMTKFATFVSVLVLIIVTLFMAFLKFLSSRTEKNAIKAILNEIEKDIERDPLLNFSSLSSKQMIPL